MLQQIIIKIYICLYCWMNKLKVRILKGMMMKIQVNLEVRILKLVFKLDFQGQKLIIMKKVSQRQELRQYFQKMNRKTKRNQFNRSILFLKSLKKAFPIVRKVQKNNFNLKVIYIKKVSSKKIIKILIKKIKKMLFKKSKNNQNHK